MRLPLPFVAWGFLLILLVTGLALTWGHGWAPVLLLKLALVALFVLVQVLLTRRPRPALIFANLALGLAIVVVSGLLTRI